MKTPIPEEVAKAFARVLCEWLSSEEMAEVNRINKADGYTDETCASQDFCDANMAMDEALKLIVPDLYKEAWNEFESPEYQDPCKPSGPLWTRMTDLWNEAWMIAKKADFYVKAA